MIKLSFKKEWEQEELIKDKKKEKEKDKLVKIFNAEFAKFLRNHFNNESKNLLLFEDTIKFYLKKNHNNYDETQKFLENFASLNDLVLNLPLSLQIKDDLEQIKINKSKVIDIIGEPCKYCQSIRTLNNTIQIRSGDEGASSLNKCTTCGKFF